MKRKKFAHKYELAVKNAQKVIDEWIETARELGRKILKPKGRLMYAWRGGINEQ